jgi:Flp pilus assembly protein TadD
LNLDHSVAVSRSLLEPWTTVPALLLIGGLVYLAVRLARRDPLASFAVLWFLGNLLIESSFIGLELMFEHRTYIPLMFAIPVPVALVFRYIRPQWAALALLGAILVVFAAWTHQRNAVWDDPVLLWKDTASKSPNKIRPLINLGSSMADRGDFQLAVQTFQQALKIDPDSVEAHQNLGYVYIRLNKLQDGIARLKKVLTLQPDNALAHNNLGLAYLLNNSYGPAEFHLRRAIEIKPDYAGAYNNLGLVYRRKGDLNDAIRCLRLALKIDPGYAEAHNNLGYALMLDGDLEGARRYFLESLRIAPQYELAKKNLRAVEELLDKIPGTD